MLSICHYQLPLSISYVARQQFQLPDTFLNVILVRVMRILFVFWHDCDVTVFVPMCVGMHA